MPILPSRSRFSEYRQSVRDRHASGQRPPAHGHAHGDRNPKKLGERDRKFRELFSKFLDLTANHRGQILTALGLLTIGIVLRLIPPLGTKLAIDSALTTPPKALPGWLEALPLPTAPMDLLLAIAGVVVVVTMISTVVHLSSRWIATKTVNQTQVIIRRRVFEHAIRLPLNNVYDMKRRWCCQLDS